MEFERKEKTSDTRRLSLVSRVSLLWRFGQKKIVIEILVTSYLKELGVVHTLIEIFWRIPTS